MGFCAVALVGAVLLCLAAHAQNLGLDAFLPAPSGETPPLGREIPCRDFPARGIVNLRASSYPDNSTVSVNNCTLDGVWLRIIFDLQSPFQVVFNSVTATGGSFMISLATTLSATLLNLTSSLQLANSTVTTPATLVKYRVWLKDSVISGMAGALQVDSFAALTEIRLDNAKVSGSANVVSFIGSATGSFISHCSIVARDSKLTSFGTSMRLLSFSTSGIVRNLSVALTSTTLTANNLPGPADCSVGDITGSSVNNVTWSFLSSSAIAAGSGSNIGLLSFTSSQGGIGSIQLSAMNSQFQLRNGKGNGNAMLFSAVHSIDSVTIELVNSTATSIIDSQGSASVAYFSALSSTSNITNVSVVAVNSTLSATVSAGYVSFALYATTSLFVSDFFIGLYRSSVFSSTGGQNANALCVTASALTNLALYVGNTSKVTVQTLGLASSIALDFYGAQLVENATMTVMNSTVTSDVLAVGGYSAWAVHVSVTSGKASNILLAVRSNSSILARSIAQGASVVGLYAISTSVGTTSNNFTILVAGSLLRATGNNPYPANLVFGQCKSSASVFQQSRFVVTHSTLEAKTTGLGVSTMMGLISTAGLNSLDATFVALGTTLSSTSTAATSLAVGATSALSVPNARNTFLFVCGSRIASTLSLGNFPVSCNLNATTVVLNSTVQGTYCLSSYDSTVQGSVARNSAFNCAAAGKSLSASCSAPSNFLVTNTSFLFGDASSNLPGATSDPSGALEPWPIRSQCPAPLDVVPGLPTPPVYPDGWPFGELASWSAQLPSNAGNTATPCEFESSPSCNRRLGCVWVVDRPGCLPRLCTDLNSTACLDNTWCRFNGTRCVRLECNTFTSGGGDWNATCRREVGCKVMAGGSSLGAGFSCSALDCRNSDSPLSCPINCFWDSKKQICRRGTPTTTMTPTASSSLTVTHRADHEFLPL